MTTFSGKIVYQDLVEIKTLKVAKNQTIALGMLISKNGTGFLIPAPKTAGNPCVFKNGLFQALEKITTPNSGTDGDWEIQVACIRSRIAVALGAGVLVGGPVQTTDNDNTKLVPVEAGPAKYTVVGTLFEIDEKPDAVISLDGDIGIVDLGLGVV